MSDGVVHETADISLPVLVHGGDSAGQHHARKGRDLQPGRPHAMNVARLAHRVYAAAAVDCCLVPRSQFRLFRQLDV